VRRAGRRERSRGRARAATERERGASLVEFGIIEFGIAYNDDISIRSGNREAARLGVVNDVDNAPSCKINGSTVTPPADLTNTTDATNALICKAKDRIDLDQTKAKVKILIRQLLAADERRRDPGDLRQRELDADLEVLTGILSSQNTDPFGEESPVDLYDIQLTPRFAYIPQLVEASAPPGSSANVHILRFRPIYFHELFAGCNSNSCDVAFAPGS
jgi:hypothetical protein